MLGSSFARMLIDVFYIVTFIYGQTLYKNHTIGKDK